MWAGVTLLHFGLFLYCLTGEHVDAGAHHVPAAEQGDVERAQASLQLRVQEVRAHGLQPQAAALVFLHQQAHFHFYLSVSFLPQPS